MEMKPEVAGEALQILTAISSAAFIGLDNQGRVDLWNASATALFGWAEDEVTGHALPAALEALANGQDESGVTVTVHARDGRELSVESRVAKRMDGGLVITATDFSHVKAESRFRELLEAAPDAIIEADEEGRIVLLNRVAEKLFGYTREELLGRNVDSLLPPEMVGRHAGHRARYRASP